MKRIITTLISMLGIATLFFLLGLYFDDFFPPERITTGVISKAEVLSGLSFTDAERDSMRDGLEEHLENYRVVRTVALENSVVPSVAFNPLPAGWTPDHLKDGFRAGDYSGTMMPGNQEELAFYSIGELARLIKTGKISSEKLTAFFLERLKRYGPKLECIITLNEEEALAQARKMDAELAAGRYRGLLHGIPYGIKDLFATKGMKTTWGAKPFEEQVIDVDATVVEKLRDAGAVLAVKTTMGALAWGDVWFGGKTRNPWDLNQGSSGSSAGSAASVSAGLVPFAIGTETWGSIVSPSTVCGVTGLRPTYGRVSRYGAMALSWSMDKIGPICRTAEDAAIVLKAIAGPDGKDRSVFDYPFFYDPEKLPGALRIGYVKEDFEQDYGFRIQDSLALDQLRSMGIELIPVTLPDVPVEHISFILSAEAAAAFDELTRSNRDDLLVRQIKNAWPNEFRTARFIPAVEYINANRIRTKLIEEMDKIFRDVDLFVAPSWQGSTLLMTNLTGHPCVVLPNGFDSENHPTSMTLIGDLFEEGQILAVAGAYQKATGFHRKHPTLDW